MKILFYLVHSSLLMTLIMAKRMKRQNCSEDQVWNEKTYSCGPPECPPGQDWFEAEKKCAKFRMIATPLSDDSFENAGLNKKCRKGFVYLEARQICGAKPKICNNELCQTKTLRSQRSNDCKPGRTWNQIRQACAPIKSVRSIVEDS